MNRSWTFGQKLGFGFGAVVFLAVCMAAVSYLSLRLVTSQQDDVLNKNVQNLSDAQQIVILRYKKAGGLRGFLATQDPRFTTDVQSSNTDFEAAMAVLKGRVISDDDRQRLSEIDRAWDTHDTGAQKIMDMARKGDVKTALTEYDDNVSPLGDTVTAKVAAYQAQQKSLLDQARQQSASVASSAIMFVIGICIVALAVAAMIAFFLSRSLTRQIGASVQHVRSSSAELQAAATQQASGAKEQATAMKEITTTIGELLVTSRQIDESAQQVSKMSEDTAGNARVGNEHVNKSQEVLQSIRKQVDTIVHHMLDLGRKSQQIGSILEIINELSEQTNILAINATIEAAGAGEGGKRFAVVGDEIRKLADRVGGSAKEIRNLIEEIRAAVNTTVMATETGSKTVEAGTQRFAELADAFQKIGRLVETTNGAAREIKLSTKQQTTAVEQVNVAVSNVSQATKETEASSSQTLQTASQLKTLSDDLVRLISSSAA